MLDYIETDIEKLKEENKALKAKIKEYEADTLMPEKNQQINALTSELEGLYKALIYIPEIHYKFNWQFKIDSNENMIKKLHFWENDRKEQYLKENEEYQKELDKVNESLNATKSTIEQKIEDVSARLEATRQELAELLEKEKETNTENMQRALNELPLLRLKLYQNVSDINLADYKTVRFGNYYYDTPTMDIKYTNLYSTTNNPLKTGEADMTKLMKKPVDWVVLEENDDAMLIATKYCIDCHRFNERHREFTWEDSDIRRWLNEKLINDLFSEEEQALILEVEIPNDENKRFHIPGGNATRDKLFLLSEDESKLYFYANNHRAAVPTPYTKYKGVFEYGGTCWWWLRSPGANRTFAADVDVSGGLTYLGDFGISYLQGVRPALWVRK